MILFGAMGYSAAMATKKPIDPAVDLQRILADIRNRRERRTKKKPPPALKDHIVAFIDLLGFRDQVLSMPPKEAGRQIQKLEFLFSSVVGAHKPTAGDQHGIEVRFFSDCFCLALPLDKSDLESYLDGLFWFLVHIVHIQGEFIGNGQVLRGGIAVGLHYSSESLIFSPAQIRAYEVESKSATYPMVMLHDSVLESLQAVVARHKKKPVLSAAALKGDLESIFGLIATDESGKHFVNYLGFWTELDEPTPPETYFAAHKEIIEQGAELHRGVPSLLEKYRWMARYHNAYMTTTLESPQALIIPDEVFGTVRILETDD